MLSMALAFALAQTPTPPSAIAVFVGPQTRDGFVDVDRGVLDSIKDIQAELRKQYHFRVVQKADDARIVLVVVSRRISGTAGAVGVTSSPTVTTMIPIDRRAIDVILRVGAYQRAITSESADGTWRAAAKRVVEDLNAWADANREALVTHDTAR